PGRGCGNRATTIPTPLPGLAAFRGRNRWFAPPANIRDASGVLYSMPSPRSGPKLGTFVTVFSCDKTVSVFLLSLLVPKFQFGNVVVPAVTQPDWARPGFPTLFPRAAKQSFEQQVHSQTGVWERGDKTNSSTLNR